MEIQTPLGGEVYKHEVACDICGFRHEDRDFYDLMSEYERWYITHHVNHEEVPAVFRFAFIRAYLRKLSWRFWGNEDYCFECVANGEATCRKKSIPPVPVRSINAQSAKKKTMNEL